MIREALTHLHWSVLPVVSMFMFLSVFIGVIFWAYRKESKEVYSQMSGLPLEETSRGGIK